MSIGFYTEEQPRSGQNFNNRGQSPRTKERPAFTALKGLNPFRALRYTTFLDPRLHRRLLKFRPFRPKKTLF